MVFVLDPDVQYLVQSGGGERAPYNCHAPVANTGISLYRRLPRSPLLCADFWRPFEVESPTYCFSCHWSIYNVASTIGLS